MTVAKMAFVYSCCFWFSLRLGGIIIGVLSMIQALISLSAFCMAYEHIPGVKEVVSDWLHSMQLIYVKYYFENFVADPEKYITIAIVLTCIYFIVCISYIYGAYMCNPKLLIGFIFYEMVRLVSISVAVTTWLLILKENTMDIGLLIGASVASGFLLLGMFYLWVCAASLPTVIHEMDRDEQAATIAKLQRLVEASSLSPYEYNHNRYLRGVDTPHPNLYHIR